MSRGDRSRTCPAANILGSTLVYCNKLECCQSPRIEHGVAGMPIGRMCPWHVLMLHAPGFCERGQPEYRAAPVLLLCSQRGATKGARSTNGGQRLPPEPLSSSQCERHCNAVQWGIDTAQGEMCGLRRVSRRKCFLLLHVCFP